MTAQNPNEIIKTTQKTGAYFGIEIKLKKGQKTPQNITEAADIAKETLLNLKDIDLNIKSMLYHQLSGVFLGIKRNKDALLFINESLKITPGNIPALLNKGLIFDNLGKLNDSIDCYNRIIELDENNKFALNNKAHIMVKKGKIEDALPLANTALEVDPEFIVAIDNKVNILSLLNKKEEALNFLESKLKDHEDSKILLQTKVNLLINLKDFKEAMILNDQLLDIDPENINAINSKGVIYENNSKYQKPDKYLPMALEWFDKVVEKDKNDNYPLGWANKIICVLNSGNLTHAEDLINEILEIFPNSPEILNEKGIILLNKGGKRNTNKALKYLNRALKYRYGEEIVKNKANALLILHKYNDVIKTLNTIPNNKNPNTWVIKGDAYRNLHQIRNSNQCYKKSKEYTITPKSLLED